METLSNHQRVLSTSRDLKFHHIDEYRAAMALAWDPTNEGYQPRNAIHDPSDRNQAILKSIEASRNLASLAITVFNGLEAAQIEHDRTLQELESANALSKDKITDSLTRKGFQQLMEDLSMPSTPDGQSLLNILSDGSWDINVTLVDLDKLKQHNDLGGQAGGDEVIIGFSSVLTGKLFRRNGGEEGKDLPPNKPHPNKSEHVDHINLAVKKRKSHDIVIRNGGDEIAVVSIQPKEENDQRTHPDDDFAGLEAEKIRLENALSNLYIEYPSDTQTVSSNAVSRDGKIINYIKSGEKAVRAELTTTFAITKLNTLSIAVLEETFIRLDDAIKEIKSSRDGLVTKGAIV